MDESFDPAQYRQSEWLEANGLGGYAMGTVLLARTRRYHALLCRAMEPPAGRVVLVNGFDAWAGTPFGDYAISAQAYQPGVIQPDGASRIVGFTSEPWPTWQFRLEDGTLIEQELFVVHGTPLCALRWRLVEPSAGVILTVRPLISGRDHHALHIENPVFNFGVERSMGKVVWRPYEGLPAVVAFSNGDYMHEPMWYKNFYYALEHERGLPDTEDLAAPGIFRFNLSAEDGVLMFCPEGHDYSVEAAGGTPAEIFERLRDGEAARRSGFATPLLRAADQYLAERGEGMTIMAGYPWFADWGRDTFIAMRGMCLATGRLEVARSILLAWAKMVSQGMLPNCFADGGAAPEFNAVDASLWFVIAAHEYLAEAKLDESAEETITLREACRQILDGYRNGTRYRIGMDEDGLIFAGEPGVQLTWMDAKVGDWVMTARIGKPVEIQALWINALELSAAWEPEFGALAARARGSFQEKFWNAERQCLFDVIDANGEAGRADGALRPNQIFAVGGLPHNLLPLDRARAVVEVVERELVTPLGLRTLERGEQGYLGHYAGGQWERDSAYHQGTVWPWLMGAFAEAWVRVNGNNDSARTAAREKFLAPLLGALGKPGLEHLPEIAEGDAPHAPKGCPFQAWSVGELLRLEHRVLNNPPGA